MIVHGSELFSLEVDPMVSLVFSIQVLNSWQFSL